MGLACSKELTLNDSNPKMSSTEMNDVAGFAIDSFMR